jgi:hypothetical protein
MSKARELALSLLPPREAVMATNKSIVEYVAGDDD